MAVDEDLMADLQMVMPVLPPGWHMLHLRPDCHNCTTEPHFVRVVRPAPAGHLSPCTRASRRHHLHSLLQPALMLHSLPRLFALGLHSLHAASLLP